MPSNDTGKWEQIQHGQEFLTANLDRRVELYLESEERQALYLKLSSPKLVVDFPDNSASDLRELYFKIHEINDPHCCSEKKPTNRCLDSVCQQKAFGKMFPEYRHLLIRELCDATDLAKLILLLPTESEQAFAFARLLEDRHRDQLLRWSSEGSRLVEVITRVQKAEQWYSKDRYCIATSSFLESLRESQRFCTFCVQRRYRDSAFIDNVSRIRAMCDRHSCHEECFRQEIKCSCEDLKDSFPKLNLV